MVSSDLILCLINLYLMRSIYLIFNIYLTFIYSLTSKIIYLVVYYKL
jgi:hypothetical protein